FLSFTQTISVTASWSYLDIIWKATLMSSLAAFHLDTQQKITAMIWTIVLAQGYSAYQINLQYFQDGYSFWATNNWGWLDNNTYSVLTLPIIACSGALAVYSRHWWQRMIAGGIAVLQIHQIMLLDSRGCMIAGVCMAVVFVINMPRSKNAILSVSVLLLAGSLLAGPSVVKEFNSSFGDQEGLDASAQSRYVLWRAGWQITKDYPLLGVGPNCGKFLVPEYWDSDRTGTERIETNNKALHNLFFEISTGCGLPAAILYTSHFILVVLVLLYYHWQRHSFPATEHPLGMPMLAVIAGQPGYWVASMFSSGALMESTYICLAVGAATLCVHAKMLPATRKLRQPVYGTAAEFGQSIA
ncbi:MAG: O-antigen ligase family protein, partial [Pirellulales bacterium]